MAYPWASFGSFLFARDEQPLFRTDSGWNRAPTVNRARPLGSATDSIVTLAVGSAVRSLEVYLSPSRFTALEALVNTSATFTDWERPTPNTGSAFLRRVRQLEWLAVKCDDGVTRKRIRTLVEFISQ